ncbi:hypothetical protein [Methanobrevibacter curvatus]|uniref:Uncharacterized protein n=1 Tax=Methanobrevibacter curvatus TaxID=49547 RepID=A0A166CAU8_9EURY|nr:hypothetical protein [Methanobrevibacter curvatus]KZX14312.1 hypothetical protein MBCUR_05360 [Methanobrevibacter curvatus]
MSINLLRTNNKAPNRIMLNGKSIKKIMLNGEIVYENVITFTVHNDFTYNQWATNNPNNDYTHVFIENGHYGNDEEINLTDTGTKIINGESNNVYINARFKFNTIDEQSSIKNLTMDGTNVTPHFYQQYLFRNCCNLENITITNYNDQTEGSNHAFANYMFYNCINLHNIIIENCILGGRDVGSHWRSFCGIDNLDGLIFRNNIIRTHPYVFYALFRSYDIYTCKNINNVLIENNTGTKMLFLENGSLRFSNFSNIKIKVDNITDFYGLDSVDGVDNVKICIGGGKTVHTQIKNCNNVSNCNLTSSYVTYNNSRNNNGVLIGSNGDGESNTVSSNPCGG